MVQLFDSVPAPPQPVVEPVESCPLTHLAPSIDHCPCGNIYAEDSDFCRMCGKQRVAKDVIMHQEEPK